KTIDRRGLDFKLFDKSLGRGALAAEVDKPEPRNVAQSRKRTVCRDRHFKDHAMATSVFGNVCNPEGDGTRRRIDPHRAAAQYDLARIGRREAKQYSRQLCSARAN